MGRNSVICDDTTCIYNRDGHICNTFVIRIHPYYQLIDKEEEHFPICRTYEEKKGKI